MTYPNDFTGYTQITGAIIFLVAVALMIWEFVRPALPIYHLSLNMLTLKQTYTTHPGPSTYYSPFIGIVYSIFLAFGSFQLVIISYTHYARNSRSKSSYHSLSFVYWISQIFCGLLSIIFIGLLKKTDCIANTTLIIIIGCLGALSLSEIRHDTNRQLSMPHGIVFPPRANVGTAGSCKFKAYSVIFRWCNRALKTAHIILLFTYALLLADLHSAYK